jgi:hypothetical protein
MNSRDEPFRGGMSRPRGRPRLMRHGDESPSADEAVKAMPFPDIAKVAPLPVKLTQVRYLNDKTAESKSHRGFIPEPQVTYVDFSEVPLIVKYKNSFRNLCLLTMFIFVLLLLNTTV